MLLIVFRDMYVLRSLACAFANPAAAYAAQVGGHKEMYLFFVTSIESETYSSAAGGGRTLTPYTGTGF